MTSVTDQYQSDVAVRERPLHAVPASDLPVQLFEYVIGADTDPMLAGKIAVGQRFLNAVLDLLGTLLQLHDAQLNDYNLCLLVYAFFLSLA